MVSERKKRTVFEASTAGYIVGPEGHAETFERSYESKDWKQVREGLEGRLVQLLVVRENISSLPE